MRTMIKLLGTGLVTVLGFASLDASEWPGFRGVDSSAVACG